MKSQELSPIGEEFVPEKDAQLPENGGARALGRIAKDNFEIRPATSEPSPPPKTTFEGLAETIPDQWMAITTVRATDLGKGKTFEDLDVD